MAMGYFRGFILAWRYSSGSVALAQGPSTGFASVEDGNFGVSGICWLRAISRSSPGLAHVAHLFSLDFGLEVRLPPGSCDWTVPACTPLLGLAEKSLPCN